MTERSYPFLGAGATSDAEFSAMFGDVIGQGVKFTDGNDLKVTANSSGLKVFVALGEAGVGGQWYRLLDAPKELPISPGQTGGGALPRIDTVVLRRDYAVKSIVLAVKEGLYAASPVPPTLVNSASVVEVALADVPVPANAVTIPASAPVDRRKFITRGMPAGALTMYAGGVIPGGWLLADGRVLTRVDFPALYAAIGTAYNTGGETATQFRLPNGRGRFAFGSDATTPRGATGGEKEHTLTVAEMPSHAHRQNVSAGTGPGAAIRRDYQSDGSGVAYDQGINTNPTGLNAPHNNMPPFLTFDFIIKT